MKNIVEWMQVILCCVLAVLVWPFMAVYYIAMRRDWNAEANALSEPRDWNPGATRSDTDSGQDSSREDAKARRDEEKRQKDIFNQVCPRGFKALEWKNWDMENETTRRDYFKRLWDETLINLGTWCHSQLEEISPYTYYEDCQVKYMFRQVLEAFRELGYIEYGYIAGLGGGWHSTDKGKEASSNANEEEKRRKEKIHEVMII